MRTATLIFLTLSLTSAAVVAQNNCPGCKRTEVVPPATGPGALPPGYAFTYSVDWSPQSRDGSCFWSTSRSLCGVRTSCNGGVMMKVTNLGFDWIDADCSDLVYRADEGFTITFTALTCGDMRCKAIRLTTGGGTYKFGVGCSACETAP